MRLTNFILCAAVVVALTLSAASFSMPSLLGQQIVPGSPVMMKQTQLVAPSAVQTPSELGATPFTLSVSGNVYFDKLPVQGAEVTVYVNGVYRAKTTAGDIYMFKVPGVRIGDVLRVDAKYQGYTGTASEKVKFKSIYLDVYIKSDRSFIRSALEMLPTSDDLAKSQQQKQPTTQQPAASSAGTGTGTGNGVTSSAADANKLSSDIFNNAFQSMGNKGNMPTSVTTVPATDSAFDTAMGSKLQDAVKLAGV
jgi:hypothetical protein